LAKDTKIPKRLNDVNRSGPFQIETTTQTKGGPSLKGNIGPAKKGGFNGGLDTRQKKLFSKMADEFDIDKVIPKGDQITRLNAEAKHDDLNQSNGSFNLSVQIEDVDSIVQYSQDGSHAAITGGANTAGATGFGVDLGAQEEEGSGLITSDSDFDKAADAAGYTGYEAGEAQRNTKVVNKKTFNIQKDISKTFKRMLTSNHNRSYSDAPK
jgi:hypothetical protein